MRLIIVLAFMLMLSGCDDDVIVTKSVCVNKGRGAVCKVTLSDGHKLKIQGLVTAGDALDCVSGDDGTLKSCTGINDSGGKISWP